MESASHIYTGISCGGGLCNVCLAYLSVPVFRFSIPKGGGFIVSSVAPNCAASRPLASAPSRKSFHFNDHFANKI
jgi:hypothetical protein